MAERRYTCEIHRARQHMEDRKRNLLRHYSTLDNAVEGATRFLLRHGRVNDVCEIHHAITGMQLATVKMTLAGRLLTDKVWEREIK